ncbi:MAG: tryptophan--tRNA ligase [Candidatus Gracilibacteria bacterium]|nr:tryptophan--tRNA ligase [Candidatus Gracilibacteria bacterium]
MKRVLSGIQPSGDLHLGNYFGAIQQWVKMQENHECFFFLADLHSLTSQKDPDALRKQSYEAALTYLACGIDPSKVVIFRQSDVACHTELAWILATLCPMGLMERAHSYKDKTAKGMLPNVGLFTYPVLMAADILLYSADLVPVGKDQKQHVEITRDLVEKFHHHFGEAFAMPDPFIPEEVAIVPGVDGQKMSKSYKNTIPIFCEQAELKKITMRIVTDSAEVEDKKEPEGNTIYELYKLVAPDKADDMANKFREGGYGYGELKKDLLSGIEDFLDPIWEERRKLEARKGYIEEILENGAQKAEAEASKVMEKVRSLVGLR